jgi:hypothetical protein
MCNACKRYLFPAVDTASVAGATELSIKVLRISRRVKSSLRADRIILSAEIDRDHVAQGTKGTGFA